MARKMKSWFIDGYNGWSITRQCESLVLPWPLNEALQVAWVTCLSHSIFPFNHTLHCLPVNQLLLLFSLSPSLSKRRHHYFHLSLTGVQSSLQSVAAAAAGAADIRVLPFSLISSMSSLSLSLSRPETWNLREEKRAGPNVRTAVRAKEGESRKRRQMKLGESKISRTHWSSLVQENSRTVTGTRSLSLEAPEQTVKHQHTHSRELIEKASRRRRLVKRTLCRSLTSLSPSSIQFSAKGREITLYAHPTPRLLCSLFTSQ